MIQNRGHTQRSASKHQPDFPRKCFTRDDTPSGVTKCFVSAELRSPSIEADSGSNTFCDRSSSYSLDKISRSVDKRQHINDTQHFDSQWKHPIPLVSVEIGRRRRYVLRAQVDVGAVDVRRSSTRAHAPTCQTRILSRVYTSESCHADLFGRVQKFKFH